LGLGGGSAGWCDRGQIGGDAEVVASPNASRRSIEDSSAGSYVQCWAVAGAAYEDVVDAPSGFEFPRAVLGGGGQAVFRGEGVPGLVWVQRGPGVAVAHACSVERLSASPVSDAGGVRMGIEIAGHDDVYPPAGDFVFE
jgi:hypothetical protein